MNWASIGSGNGLSPSRRHAIPWTNAVLLSIEPLKTNFSEIRIGIISFNRRKCIWRCRLPEWWPFCPGGDDLKNVLLMAHSSAMKAPLWSHVAPSLLLNRGQWIGSGLTFIISKLDWGFIFADVMLYTISYYTGPRHTVKLATECTIKINYACDNLGHDSLYELRNTEFFRMN